MIYVTNIRNLKHIRGDQNYAIVRNIKARSAWLERLDALAPSPDLFHKYMALKNAGKWRTSSFRDIYLPQFLKEIRYSQEAARVLNKLVEDDKAGQIITLSCFCTDESICHRSIIAGLLQGAGANVTTDTGTDYSRYYNMYLNTKN